MYRLHTLPLFLLCILVFGCGSKTTKTKILSEIEFTEKINQSLTKEFPKEHFIIAGRLTIISGEARGDEQSYFLDNLYSSYKMDPSNLDNITAGYIESIRDIFNDDPINISNIVPTIKPTEYIDEVKELSEGESWIVYETYNEDLAIVYGVDDPASIAMLNQNQLDSLKISKDTLLSFATKNLKRIIGSPSIIQTGDKTYGLIAGGVYEVSLILFPKLWTKENFPVDGDFIVGMPTRDLLLVTGSKNKAGIESVKADVKKYYDQGDHTISPYLFVYKNGKFQRFNE